MAGAVIRINGVAGDKDNLPLGVGISLTNGDTTGITTQTWTILDSPLDLQFNPSGTAPAGLTLPQVGIYPPIVFIPDIPGEYLIQLVSSDGTNTYTDTRVAVVRETFLGLDVPAARRSGTILDLRGWAKPVNFSLKDLAKLVATGSHFRVAYTGGATLPAGTCVKVTGVIDGRTVLPNVLPPGTLPGDYIAEVDVALATDSAIFGKPVLVLLEPLSPLSRFSVAVSTGLVDFFDTTSLGAPVVGSIVFLSNTGALSLAPGTRIIQLGWVAKLGATDGAIFLSGEGVSRISEQRKVVTYVLADPRTKNVVWDFPFPNAAYRVEMSVGCEGGGIVVNYDPVTRTASQIDIVASDNFDGTVYLTGRM